MAPRRRQPISGRDARHVSAAFTRSLPVPLCGGSGSCGGDDRRGADGVTTERVWPSGMNGHLILINDDRHLESG